MADTPYTVSLWNGPDVERVVVIDAPGPREAAARAEDENPGFEAWFVGDEITAGRCPSCDRVLLIEDDMEFDPATRTQRCGSCASAPSPPE